MPGMSLTTIGMALGMFGGAAAAVTWTTQADSSDSSLLSGQDEVVAVYDGATYQYFGKTGSTWKTLWVDTDGGLLRGDELGATAVTLASDGPAPFSAGYENATDRLEGARSIDDTFEHETDCLIEWVADETAGTGSFQLDFRQQALDKNWRIYWNGTGTVQLIERVDAGTVRAQSTGLTPGASARYMVVCDDETIKVYRDNILLFTYSSAANFKLETEGRLHIANATVSDIVTWPRVPGAAAIAALEAV